MGHLTPAFDSTLKVNAPVVLDRIAFDSELQDILSIVKNSGQFGNAIIGGGAIVSKVMGTDSHQDIDVFIGSIKVNQYEINKVVQPFCEQTGLRLNATDVKKMGVGVYDDGFLVYEFTRGAGRKVQLIFFDNEKSHLPKFDISCCEVFWDGESLTGRGLENFSVSHNPFYEKVNYRTGGRIIKYAKRGVPVYRHIGATAIASIYRWQNEFRPFLLPENFSPIKDSHEFLGLALSELGMFHEFIQEQFLKSVDAMDIAKGRLLWKSIKDTVVFTDIYDRKPEKPLMLFMHCISSGGDINALLMSEAVPSRL